MYDVIIIGGGPAGMSASIYTARKKLKTLLLTEDFGGQAAKSGEVENYLGFIKLSGAELISKFQEHIEAIGVETKTAAVESIEKLDKGYGNYDTGTDVITIREDSLNSHVVLHEALHGFTASLVLGWQSKYIVNGNVTRLNNLYEFLKTNHPEIVNQYAFSDLVEFISEAFSNTNFQKQLSAIPYKKGVENVKGLESLGTAFVKLILKLLGGKNLKLLLTP